MLMLLLMLALSGGDDEDFKLAIPMTVTKVYDKDYGVVCYSLVEMYRGVVGFSCVKADPLPQSHWTEEDEETLRRAIEKAKKTAETAK